MDHSHKKLVIMIPKELILVSFANLNLMNHCGITWVSFVMCISGAKLKEHCLNVSSDILYSDQYQYLGNCAPTPPLTQQ